MVSSPFIKQAARFLNTAHVLKMPKGERIQKDSDSRFGDLQFLKIQ